MKDDKNHTDRSDSEVRLEADVMRLLAEIKEKRSKLPGNWYWDKCYEIAYSRAGIRKHWALKNAEEGNCVASYRLLLTDLTLEREEINKDETMLFIENSLEYIDALLAIVDKLSKQNA